MTAYDREGSSEILGSYQSTEKERDDTDKDDDSLFIGKYSQTSECEQALIAKDQNDDVEQKVVPSIFGNAMKNYRDLINWKYSAPQASDPTNAYGVDTHTHTPGSA